jgi:hypothetical protein
MVADRASCRHKACPHPRWPSPTPKVRLLAAVTCPPVPEPVRLHTSRSSSASLKGMMAVMVLLLGEQVGEGPGGATARRQPRGHGGDDGPGADGGSRDGQQPAPMSRSSAASGARQVKRVIPMA